MSFWEFASLLSAFAILLYGVRLMLRTPASDYFFFEIEAGGKPHRFYFSKTSSSSVQKELDSLLPQLLRAKEILEHSQEPQTIEQAYRFIKSLLLQIAGLVDIDRWKILEFLKALDDEIEVKQMLSHIGRHP